MIKRHFLFVLLLRHHTTYVMQLRNEQEGFQTHGAVSVT